MAGWGGGVIPNIFITSERKGFLVLVEFAIASICTQWRKSASPGARGRLDVNSSSQA